MSANDFISWLQTTRNIYYGEVLDSNDPLMLGRIRGRRLTDNYNDIIKSITDPPWNEEKDPWTERDPFVFMPLLPYYIYSVPKIDEMCLVMYMSPDDKFINQYYVQSTFYSPTATGFQYYQGADKGMGTGIQISNAKPLKNRDGSYTDKEVHKGVFPEPGDNSLLGRGSADVIVKENEVLIRAGKFKGKELQPNTVPAANQQRGFLQLSKSNPPFTMRLSGSFSICEYNKIKLPPTLVRFLGKNFMGDPRKTKSPSEPFFMYSCILSYSFLINTLSFSSFDPRGIKMLSSLSFNMSRNLIKTRFFLLHQVSFLLFVLLYTYQLLVFGINTNDYPLQDLMVGMLYWYTEDLNHL